MMMVMVVMLMSLTQSTNRLQGFIKRLICLFKVVNTYSINSAVVA
jgi:hypothetical protein